MTTDRGSLSTTTAPIRLCAAESLPVAGLTGPGKLARFRPKLLESVAIWAVAVAAAGCQNAAIPRRQRQQLSTVAATPGDRPGDGAGRGEPMSRATTLQGLRRSR